MVNVTVYRYRGIWAPSLVENCGLEELGVGEESSTELEDKDVVETTWLLVDDLENESESDMNNRNSKLR